MSEVKTLKEELSSLKEVVAKNNDSTQKLLFLINNDPETGRKGLFSDVKEHTLQISELKKKLMTTSSNRKLMKPLRKEKTSFLALLAGLFGRLSLPW